MKMNAADVQRKLIHVSAIGARTNVKHLYCDKCGENVERLYEFDGKELCGDCVLKELEVVE